MRTIVFIPSIVFMVSTSLAGLAGCRDGDRQLEDGGSNDGGGGSEDAPVDTPPGGCRSHEQCGDERLCNETTRDCEPVYDRLYRVGITNVTLHEEHDPDGDPWDDDGSFPDPWVCLIFGEGEEYCTDIEYDTASPGYNTFLVEVLISQYQRLQVELCDDDAPDEPQCWLVGDVSALYVATLRAGSLTIYPDNPAHMDDWAITMSFSPTSP